MENTNKKNIIGLMGACLMNNVLYMFLNTFMIAYFFTLTNYDYKLISIYYIMSFILLMITFLILGRIIKRKTKVGIFRTGIVLHCIFVLLIALLKENIVNYYIYLGAFYGIVQAFFWSAGHSLINKYAGNISNKFISIRSMLSTILKIAFPLIFGFSIELTSFSYIAGIVIIVSVIQFIFSLFVKDEKDANAKKYSLIEYIKYLKDKKDEKLNAFYKIIFYEGIVHYFLEILIVLVIVMTYKTNISLGILTTIFSICSIISVYIFQKRLKNNNKIIIIGTVMLVLSVIILAIDINKVSIVIYKFFESIFLILLTNNAEQKRYEIISNNKEITEKYLVEHQVFTEVFLDVSRIICYILLFVASLYSNMLIFKLLLIAVTVCIVIYSRLMIKINKTN